MKVTPTFLYPIFGLETTTTCQHNFVVVPRFTTRVSELQLNTANTSDSEAAFLDLHLSISNDIVSTKIYD